MTNQETYCTYCGRPNPETQDHIPPACLFPPPRPSNLITVPSCLSCNEGASKDDEYFKTWLVMRYDIADHPAASKLLESIYRSLARPQKRGMLNKLVRGMRKIPVHSPGGLFLGHAAEYDVDLGRLGKVTNRIVMGLFLKEFGQRLASTHDVRSFAETGLRDINSELRTNLTNMVSALHSRPSRTIGDKVFEYTFQATLEDANTTAWLFRFFEAESFLCLTAPKDSKLPAA